MSSLRNAVSRRPHKERSQPASRQKWGLLEKHKDYSLRAADYNAKKRKLSILSSKARDRNPDEFAFGMLSASSRRAGKHGKGAEESRLGHDAVKLLKTQDAGYLRVQAARGRREIERVEGEVKVQGVMRERRRGNELAGGKGKLVFGEDGEAIVQQRKSSTEQKLEEEEDDDDDDDQHMSDADQEMNSNDDTDEDDDIDQSTKQEEINLPTLPPQQPNPPRHPPAGKAAQKAQAHLSKLKRDRKMRKRIQDARLAKLDMLKRRNQQILAAADALELQRAKMARSVGGKNRDGVRFRVRERRR